MNCALCQTENADKKNTHYLTDSVIKTALNHDGSSERETGYYFDISTNKIFTDFNFQRATSVNAVEDGLGRQATDEEIEILSTFPKTLE